MSTTIDSLQIEIQTSSANAAPEIRDLSSALADLKKNGKITTAVNNLKSLSDTLKGFTANSSASREIGKLVGTLGRLKEIGSVASIANSVKKLSEGINALGMVKMDGLDKKLSPIIDTLKPLGNIKAGGLNQITNGLLKLDQVIEALSDDNDKIKDFVEALRGFDKKLDGVAPNLTAIGVAFKSMNKIVGQMNVTFDKANIKVFNLSNTFHVLDKSIQALKKAAKIISDLIGEAIEWDGVSARFGRGFGNQAQETYSWIQKLNEKMNINVQQFMQYSSTYATMLKGFGVATEDASKMALGYMELSYDIWAGYNDIYASLSDVADAVRSAIAGEVEPIRRAGFTIVEATLKQTAANHGLEISLSEATEAQKSYLRYLTLVDQAMSQNLVGTYAKEMETAEGVMRTFEQQLKSLTQSFGTLFLPILVKVMPYVQAVIDLLSDGVQKIAAFFGIAIQDIDWSGYGKGADITDNLTDSLEGATDAAKELKNATLGIDELNILGSPDKKSTSDSSAIGTGFENIDIDSVWDESIFDGINSHVETIKNNILGGLKKILNPLKDVFGYLVDYKDTLLTIAGVVATIKLIPKVKAILKSLKSIKALKLVKEASTYFKVLRLEGKKVLPALKGSIDAVRSSLTGIQKASIVGAAGILEFVAIKDSVKALALGCEDVGAKIATIGVVVGTAAGAMYLALGPAGLAIAAITGLVGAIVGVQQANEEMMSQMVSDVFYDDVGTKITDLADQFKTLMDSIIETNQPILDNKEVIDTAAGSISNIKGNIEHLITSYERGIVSTKEFSTKVSEQLEALNAEVKTTMDAIYNNIQYALSTSLGDAIEKAGGSVQEYLAIIGKIKEDGDTLYDSLVKKQKELSVQFANGKISAEDYAVGIREVNEKLSTLSGSTSTVTTFTDKMEGLRNTVNWENDTARKNAFDKINTSATDAKAAVNDSCNEINRNLEMMKLWTTDQNAIAALDELILGNEDSRKQQLSEIDAAVNTMYGNLQTDILAGIDGVAQEAAAKWDSMNGWQRFWSGSKNEAQYVGEAIKTYRKNYVDPLSKDIQDSMDQLGTNGSVWASNAVKTMMDTAFTYTFGTDIYNYTKKVGDDIESGMNSVGVDAADGFTEGVTQREDAVKSVFSQMAQDAINSVKTTQDSHSPSKEFGKLGSDAIQGYVNSVSDNFFKIKDAFVKNFEKLFDNIANLAQQAFGESRWRGYANNVTRALSNLKMPTFKSIELKVSYQKTWLSSDKKKIIDALGLEGWPTLKFAQHGGVFDTGSLIWAGERGPEVLANAGGGRTGVMNVDQMQDAVYEGVAVANAEQNSLLREQNNLLRRLLEKDSSTSYYGGASDILSDIERKNRRDGRTVIPVGV